MASPAGLSPLFNALARNQPGHALELLAADPAAALQKLPGGFTPLHVAALGGCAAAVPALVAAGANVDAPLTSVRDAEAHYASAAMARHLSRAAGHDSLWIGNGSTPLCMACAALQVGAIAALLEAGASVREADADSISPLASLEWGTHACGSPSPAAEARRLLLAAGCDPLLTEGCAPLRQRGNMPWNWGSVMYCLREHQGAAAETYLDHVRRQVAAGRRQLSSDELADCVQAALRTRKHGHLRSFTGLAGDLPRLPELSRAKRLLLMDEAVRSGASGAVAALGSGALRPDDLQRTLSLLVLSGLGMSSAVVAGIAHELLQLGALPTLSDLNTAIDRGNAALLAALLQARPPPAVPLGSNERPVELTEEPWQQRSVLCPFATLISQVEERAEEDEGFQDDPSSMLPYASMAEALLQASLRPAVYRSILFIRPGAANFSRQRLCLAAFWADNSCAYALARALWLLISGAGWSQAEHRHWPRAFRAAARTLLLAQRRSENLFSWLPQHLVLQIIAAAALPLSPWLRED